MIGQVVSGVFVVLMLVGFVCLVDRTIAPVVTSRCHDGHVEYRWSNNDYWTMSYDNKGPIPCVKD